uniref:Origin recognition complex subunit 2 n=1 Tax=Phallusia mammillata TaxID=59560 RepID=A0A6F9DNU8_9ASCI|nr:origin recognition complex subunit 2-like [Phallusia mammillata]
MSESEVTVPVKYIGNDDIARHIKAPRSKKPTTQRGKSALSTKFVESTINDPINRGSKKDKFKTLPDEPPLVATSVGSDALLESNMDRSGTNVYSFKTPKRSKQMNKFAESARKKHDEAGIKNGGMKQNETSNEQIVTRNQYSLQANQQTDDSSSETDLTSDSGNETNERDNTDEQQPKQHRTAGGLQLPSERELYFDTHGGKKNQKQLSKTSDHTLQSLKTPQLNPDQLSNALSKHSHQSGKMKEVQEVVAAQNLLCDHHKQMFTKWLFNLCNDFNIILYGLGSKRQLMHAFCSKHLKKQSKLVVNGFFPSLSIKSVGVCLFQ